MIFSSTKMGKADFKKVRKEQNEIKTTSIRKTVRSHSSFLKTICYIIKTFKYLPIILMIILYETFCTACIYKLWKMRLRACLLKMIITKAQNDEIHELIKQWWIPYGNSPYGIEAFRRFALNSTVKMFLKFI